MSKHQHFAEHQHPDGHWTSVTKYGDPDEVAKRAACECGWRSERVHAVPPRPAGLERDERGLFHGPSYDAWIAALEVVDDACYDDWRAEHFDPLLGYEPHTLLIEGVDGGGRRHFLDGRPVHAGSGLELLTADGHWLRGRYEWSYATGAAPTFHILLGGPPAALAEDATPLVSFDLPPRAVLRWPDPER